MPAKKISTAEALQILIKALGDRISQDPDDPLSNIKINVSSIDDLLAIVDLLTKPIVVPAGYVLVSKKDWVTATDIIMLADQMLRMYQHPKTRRIMADGYTFNQEDNFDERCDALVDGSVVHPYWIGD